VHCRFADAGRWCAWLRPSWPASANLYIFPRSANGLGTVNVTPFSDVPGCRLIRGKGAIRVHGDLPGGEAD
jgi:hypothetical protein